MPFDWVTPALNIPETGLPPETREELREDLSQLDDAKPGLTDRVVDFIFDGVGVEVLDDVMAEAELKFHPMSETGVRDPREHGRKHCRMFDCCEHWAPATLARWGAYFAALYFHRWSEASRPLPPWVHCLVRFVTRRQGPYPLTANQLSATLQLVGLTPELMIAESIEPGYFPIPHDYDAFLNRHADHVASLLRELPARNRAPFMHMLNEHGADLDHWGELLVFAIADSAKQVRFVAGTILDSVPRSDVHYKKLLETGNAAQCQHALEYYAKFKETISASTLSSVRERVKSKKLHAAIDALLAETAAKATPIDTAPLDLPPLPRSDVSPPKPTAAHRAAFDAMCKVGYESAVKNHERWSAMAKQRPLIAEPIPTPLADQIFAALYDPEPWKLPVETLEQKHNMSIQMHGTALDIVPFYRLRYLKRGIKLGDSYWCHGSESFPEVNDLRVEAEVMRWVGLSATDLGAHWIKSASGLDVDDIHIWPFYAEHPEVLVDLFDPMAKGHDRGYDERAWFLLLRVIALLPFPLPAIHEKLWHLALSGTKQERLLAQQCVDRDPDAPQRRIDALAHGKKSVRENAVEWIMARGERDAIPAMHAALENEKSASTRRALEVALDHWGDAVVQSVSPTDLLADAKSVLKRGMPETVEWIDRETLPALHFADGNAVEPQLRDRWIVKAVRSKAAGADPELRREFALLREVERREFSMAIFERWLKLAEEEAVEALEEFSGTPAEWRAEDKRKKDAAKRGTTANRGLLSLVSAGVDASVVPTIERFVRRHYGQRMGQCKALLGVAASLDDASAIQLLVSIAQRFRTPAIQKEAEQLLEVMADRRGWTRDELSDRTVPTFGLDQSGEATLEYCDPEGSVTRRFALVLDPTKLLFTLRTEDGKSPKTLPGAQTTECPDSVREAKDTLKKARKGLKDTIRLQEERLVDHMCTERTWTPDVWTECYIGHPILGLLASRLLWAAFDGDKLRVSFRPLDDGTLTGVDDDAIELRPTDEIRLLHATHVDASTRDAWIRHFADYEVIPFFRQVEGAPFALPSERSAETRLDEFKGHMTTAAALSKAFKSRSYTLGPALEGSRCYTARKTFRRLGLQAVVEHTGHLIPFEDKPVALIEMKFGLVDADPDPDIAPTELGNVPPILLSEVWSDLEEFAGTGSGFRDDWENETSNTW